MKKCYKCQRPYMEPDGPGFQDVCEGCSSYLHCCQNCDFFDPNKHNNCTETQAEYVSDSNGMNHCEYLRFKSDGGGKNHGDDDGGRRFRKADWRNLNKTGGGARTKRPAGKLFVRGGSSGGRGDRAQKAREALEKLFRKD